MELTADDIIKILRHASPAERKDFWGRFIDAITTAGREDLCKTLAEISILPMGEVSRYVGLSTKQIPLHLPVTETTPGKHGVTVQAIRDHISRKTRQPSP